MIEKIRNNERLNRLEEENNLLLIIFYKNDSAKSINALEILKDFKNKHENINICSVNVSEVREIHARYKITQVPTLLVFRNAKPAEIIKGKQTLKFYEKILKKIDAFSESDEENTKAQNITVYSTPSCQYCGAVKKYLDTKGVQFTEIDISEDQTAARELVAMTGHRGVPQIDIDGEYILGFDTVKIDSLLN